MIARRNQNSGAHNCRRGTRLPLRNGQSRALREHVRDRRSKVHCLSGAQTNNHFLRASTSSMGGHCAPRHLSQYLRAFTGCSAEFPHAVCTAAPASSRAIRPKLSSLFKCSSVYARRRSVKRVEPFRRHRRARFNERMRTIPSLPADHCEQQLARHGPSARLKLPPLKCMNGLTILHWGHDSSRRAAGGSGVHRSHRTCGTSPTHSPVASPLASLREPCTRSDLAIPVRPCIGAQTGPIMITRRGLPA